MAVQKIILIALISMAAGTVGVNLAQRQENKTIIARLDELESELALLALAQRDANSRDERERAGFENNLEEVTRKISTLPATSQDDQLTAAVAKASPAVISIVISKDVPLLEVEYVNPFGNDPLFGDVGYRIPVWKQVGTRKQEIGAGTGFIIHRNGYILTNKHVVSDPEADYTVLLSTGEKKAARPSYRDDTYDLAILKIEGTGYKTVALGDSTSLKLGQTVAAIGNALGEYSNSVSVGIVSGLNRSIEAQDSDGRIEKLSGVIQTDAAINRGNSGGPLLNLSGEAIGVNVAVDRAGSNIGFAIPSNMAKNVVKKALPN